jgi:hypothetical protein
MTRWVDPVGRPRCHACNRALKPLYDPATLARKYPEIVGWGHKGRGFFCTYVCGWRWALNEVKES